MSIHTIIESYSAYEAVRLVDPEGDRVWWTTSPFLLVHLQTLGEIVRSPEAELQNEMFNALAQAGEIVVDPLCSFIQESYPWRESHDWRCLLGGQLARLFFVTFYKGHLLDLILTAAGSDRVVCVGDPSPQPLSNVSLSYGRTETIYARLAGLSPQLGVSVINHSAPRDKREAIDNEIKYRKLAASEKILSLINNTPSSWLYKLWRNLKVRRLWPSYGLSILPWPRRTIFIVKDCELIEEAALGIIIRGGRIAKLPSLNIQSTREANTLNRIDNALAKAKIKEICAHVAEQRQISWPKSFEACVELFTLKILCCCENLLPRLDAYKKSFQCALNRVKPGDEVLSSSLNSVPERLFAEHCKKVGIRVNTVDHGVTLGLSEWSLFHAAFTGMGVGDRAFYHSLRAAKAVQKFAKGQESHIVGLPSINSHPPFLRLQRKLARRLLEVGEDKHVVMIVADAERNNFIYGPHQDNDLQFLRKTCQIAEVICKSFSSSKVILKLYPTQRYFDPYNFDDLLLRLPNLTIIKNVEFRFIRTAADLIFTSSTQSTIGWAHGAGVPYIYLDFAWSPGRINGLRASLDGIDGLKAAVYPDTDQLYEPQAESMAEVLLKSS